MLADHFVNFEKPSHTGMDIPITRGIFSNYKWKKVHRMLGKTNLLGAIVAVVCYVAAILVFIFRLLGTAQYEHWIGYFEFFLAIPMIFLLLKAPQLQRSALYYIQIGCMLAWLLVEALLDYIY